jgi:hypothetical protein
MCHKCSSLRISVEQNIYHKTTYIIHSNWDLSGKAFPSTPYTLSRTLLHFSTNPHHFNLSLSKHMQGKEGISTLRTKQNSFLLPLSLTGSVLAKQQHHTKSPLLKTPPITCTTQKNLMQASTFPSLSHVIWFLKNNINNRPHHFLFPKV